MATVIIKKYNRYYFTSGDNVYELNDNTLNRLKIGITLPSQVYFRNCPYSFIGNVANLVFDGEFNMEVKRVKGTQDYEAIFTEALKKRMK